MAGLNKIMLIGNVGRDPEMRYTQSGQPVTSFSLAVNRFRGNREGDRQEETEWFDIVTWSKLAETCNQYVTKGKQIYVEGRIHMRSWEGQDGQKRSKNEVTAETVVFLGGSPSTGAMPEGSFAEAKVGEDSPDDLPF